MIVTPLDVGGYTATDTLRQTSLTTPRWRHAAVFLWKFFADSEKFLRATDLLTYTGPGLTETTVVLLGTCKRPVGSKDPVHSRPRAPWGRPRSSTMPRGASPSGTTPGWAVERLWGYRRLLCSVADDSHGKCISHLLIGAAKENCP